MPLIILNPNNFNFKSDYEWRQYLKSELLKRRGYRSDMSGLPITRSTGCEMHEGILTRANVPKGIRWHRQIYHEYNCFLLFTEEHIPCPPSRQFCIDRSYYLYGREAVRDWFYSLPFKALPFQLP